MTSENLKNDEALLIENNNIKLKIYFYAVIFRLKNDPTLKW